MNSKLENFLTRKLRPIAGNFAYNPEEIKLSSGASELIAKAYEGMPDKKYWDYHCHLIAMGTGNNHGYVNHKMHKLLSLPLKLRFNVFASAAGIKDVANADRQYIERLINLIKNTPGIGKISLLALDQFYDKMGRPHPELTRLYVPNDYLLRVCNTYPQHFLPVISIHPYRPDALKELEKYANNGVRYVKWLANSMNIDASDPICDRFYEKMIAHNMILLAHGGYEEALTVPGHQKLGNPLLYRRPLDMGLKVIIAHCAGLGLNKDLDSTLKLPTKNHTLFFRMMEEGKYKDLLFGDIAAVTQINRIGSPLKTILEKQEHHHRLINGSDYPLPGINAAYSTLALQIFGYLSKEEKKFLDEIFYYNPLLCDFVTKRTIKHPNNPGLKFSTSIFTRNPKLSFRENVISGSKEDLKHIS